MNAADQERIEQEQAEASLAFSRSIREKYDQTLVTVIADDNAAAPQGQPSGSVQDALIALREAQDDGDRTLIAVRQDRLNALIDAARPAPAPRPDFGAGARGSAAPLESDFSQQLRIAAGRPA
jgi:hypothetical protein